jgi:hypothetical protein
MRKAMLIVAAAYSAVALASLIAVRSFAGAMEELWTQGRGIETITLGAAEAIRFPLFAASLAAGATAVALLLRMIPMERSSAHAERPASPRLLWSAAVSLALGVVSVLLFRGVIGYVLAAVTPGAQPRGVDAGNVAEAVASRLTLTSIGIAVCLVIAIVPLIAALRQPRAATATPRLTAILLVVSLGVAAALAISLRAASTRYVDVGLRGAPVSTLLR